MSLRQALDQEADRRHVSVTYLVERAVAGYLADGPGTADYRATTPAGTTSPAGTTGEVAASPAPPPSPAPPASATSDDCRVMLAPTARRGANGRRRG